MKITETVCAFKNHCLSTKTGLGERVVLELSRCLRGGNYQIFCDKYFTTCHLLTYSRDTSSMLAALLEVVDMTSGDTKEVSSCVILEYVLYQHGNLVVSVWMDKKPVTMLSTLAQTDVIHTAQRWEKDGRSVFVQCSDAVVLYNKYMASVDKGGQLTQYYCVRTKCMKKNYKYIFLVSFLCIHHKCLYFIIIIIPLLS